MTRQSICALVSPIHRNLLVAMFIGLLSVSSVGKGLSPSECGRLQNPLGPFDYRKARFVTEKGEFSDRLLQDVEVNHFRPEIENLIARGTSYFGGDLDYLLRIYPNHHRALATMVRLGKKEGLDKAKGAKYLVECYFERALRFMPNDHIVRGLYANFLMEAGRRVEAELQLDRAAFDSQGIAIAQFNVGLLYMMSGNLEKAMRQAHVAQALGFDISRLQRLLEERGVWKTAEAVAELPARSASNAASSQ